MHRAAFAWAGVPGTYEARRVPAADLGAALAELRAPGHLGANLSLPHKEAALPLLDTLSGAARQIGAVNTVVRGPDGALHGENTDAPGLVAALADADMTALGGDVVVLGAGGAARAAVYAALQLRDQALGRGTVWVVNRTLARAEALAAAFGGRAGGVRAAPREAVPWAGVRLIVNASSAGLSDPQGTPLPDFDFGELDRAAVYDMVYKPAETRLMREACAAGLRAENGLGMLAHQARLAFAAWTGHDVPVGVFLDALAGRVAPAPDARPDRTQDQDPDGARP